MGCAPSNDREMLEDDAEFMERKAMPNMKDNVQAGNVDEMALTDYLEIEREIAEAEVRNPLQPLDLKTEQLHQLAEQIDDLQGNVKHLKQVTMSSNTINVVETRKFFIENGVSDNLTTEQKLFLDRLNEKEIAMTELETAKEQRKQVEIEVVELEKHAHHLQGLYKRQDKLLATIFGGEYGSLKENQLEGELDQLESQRGRILEANFKWRQGSMMLEYACKQLAVAVQKWQDLPAIPALELEIRYSVASETRNNIVAAGQNITGAQRYLDQVEFPYCHPQEVDTLNKAAQFIFTDMQSPERHGHAQMCYSTTHKRANALLQWFDTVINTTIMKDLEDINDRVKGKTLELRRERVRLIKKRIEDLYGKELHLDQTLRGRDISADELARGMMSDNQVVKVKGDELDNIGGVDAPTPLTDDELAPVPSNSVIFGSMYENYNKQLEVLSQQHQEELNLFMREQENNQKKIKGNLREKLMERRQRRARLRVEDAQRKGLAP